MISSINIGDKILWLVESRNLSRFSIYKVVIASREDFSVVGDFGDEVFVNKDYYGSYTKIYEV